VVGDRVTDLAAIVAEAAAAEAAAAAAGGEAAGARGDGLPLLPARRPAEVAAAAVVGLLHPAEPANRRGEGYFRWSRRPRPLAARG
jgi:hypothetical protein